jgi:hypothetical protein
VDRGGPIRGEVGDEIGDLVRLCSAADRDPTEAVEDDLPRVFERPAVGELEPLQELGRRNPTAAFKAFVDFARRQS